MKKKFLSFLMMLCMITSLLPTNVVFAATTSRTCGDNLTWALDDSGTLTISGTGDMTNWAYGSATPWYSLMANVRSVYIESGVTSIGDYSFSFFDKLGNVSIGVDVKNIGAEAFSSTILSSITIPDNVVKIDKYAFYDCSNLTNVSVGSGLKTLGNSAFSNCNNLIRIDVDAQNKYYSSLDGNLYDKDRTNLIQYSLGKQSTKFSVPDSVEIISAEAFYGCSNLVEVIIPNDVKSISWNVFSCCKNLAVIKVNDSNKNYSSIEGNLYNKSHSTLLQYAIGQKNTSFSIPVGVTRICERAFQGCKYLTEIIIPDTVTDVGWNCFSYCSNLTNVSIGNGITHIERSMFMECGNLKNITIPNGIKSINDYAFYNCVQLYDIIVPHSVTDIGVAAFSGCSNLTSVTLSDNITNIEMGAFENCSNLVQISIPKNISTISNYLFYGCTKLHNIELFDNITKIGYGAFYGCTLSEILYYGTETQWTKIKIDSGNNSLDNTKLVYSKRAKTTVSEDGKNFTVKPINIDNGNTIILALYNGDILTETQAATYNGEDIPFPTSEGYTKAKVFVWSNLTDIMPICDVEIVK